MSALNELLEDIELRIKEYSDTLVHELALREELDFDKVCLLMLHDFTDSQTLTGINSL